MNQPDEPNLRPLRHDANITDPDLALGARLLASSQPLPRDDVRKRRVWNALASSPGSRLGLRLTAVHVAFAGTLFAAASSAAVGRYYIEQRARATEVARADETSATSAPKRRSPSPSKRVQPTPHSVDAPLPTAELPAPPREAAPTPRAPSARVRVDGGSARKNEADAELLVEAMRARGAGDPARVSQLVDEYRAKHPQGVLQEEALILSIEAAVAQKSPNASSLAQQYLKRFPRGRFATQARRALASDSR